MKKQIVPLLIAFAFMATPSLFSSGNETPAGYLNGTTNENFFSRDQAQRDAHGIYCTDEIKRQFDQALNSTTALAKKRKQPGSNTAWNSRKKIMR